MRLNYYPKELPVVPKNRRQIALNWSLSIDPIDKSITKKQVGIPVNIMECEYFIFTFGLAHS